MMDLNSTTATSLNHRPLLRKALIGFWFFAVAYVIFFLAITIPIHYQNTVQDPTTNSIQISQLLFIIFQFTVDGLILLGFWTIAGLLFLRRSNDWMAIFISIFMIAFGLRVTEIGNQIATISGHKTMGGLIMAVADSSIVLLTLIFPNGKFVPRWSKYTAPILVVVMVCFYSITSLPIYWGDLTQERQLAILLPWYVFGLGCFVYRYFKESDIASRQQIRWIFLGIMGPFIWFLFMTLMNIAIPTLNGQMIYNLVIRTLGVFFFLTLPICFAISIARFKMFNIDLLINRSLVYFTLTVGLGITFAALLGVITIIFRNINQGEQSMIALTISAVAAGALFQPARKRLQRFVDRAIYHIQINYQDTPAPQTARPSQPSVENSTLSSYRGLKMIARGGMAEIYKAESPTSGKPVAIKVLPATLATDELFRKRFMREAQVISGLDHPNIVRVLNYGHENNTYYIVMEYLNGPDLNHLIKERKNLPLQETVQILRDIASALDYAHQTGLIHRDIKPSNIMMHQTEKGSTCAVLTDFGIAKITDAHTKITATGVLGTFDYIAPEQIQSSNELDGRADIYALGVMTYQMLTGNLPFGRSNTGALLLAHLTAPVPDIRDSLPDISKHVSYTIQRAMAKKPKDRYATATEFVQSLMEA